MTRSYTPSATYSASYTLPADGDLVNDAISNNRAEALANSIKYIYDAFDQEHDYLTGPGGHYNIDVRGAAGSAKASFRAHAADGATQKQMQFRDTSSTIVWYVETTGHQVLRSVKLDGSLGTTGVKKVQIAANSGDASSTRQIEILGTAGTMVFAVDSDGTVECVLPSYTISLSPGMFAPQAGYGATYLESYTVWRTDPSGTYAGGMNAGDTDPRRVFCSEQRLQVGDSITAVTLHCTRTAGTAVLRLRNKSAYNTTQEPGTCTVNSGSGHQTSGWTGGTHAVTDIKAYYWQLDITNGGTADDILFEFAEIAISRTRIR